jgi:hypothetical protein
MANELINQSQSRSGATVLWITIHTAEGPTDEFPSRPDLDAGSADDLLRFFKGKTDRSCHAICDDDKILDNLVPYERAAWTLRNGNNYSDNLEMCGLASWTRIQWLAHDGMLRNAATWIVRRLKARQIAPRRLTVQQVGARSARGYIDHNTYTQATHDGTHWDVGPNFPWDVLGNYVNSFFAGDNGDDDMPTAKDVWAYGIKNPDTGAVMPAETRLLDIERRVGLLFDDESHVTSVVKSAAAGINTAIAAVKADTKVSGQNETDILEALADLSDKVSALTPAPETE